METIDVEEIDVQERRRWRPSWRALPWRGLGVAIGVAAAAVAADSVVLAGEEEAPTRIEPPPVAAMSAQQETLLVHHAWADEVEIARCMADHGFVYAPAPDFDAGRVERVAAHLGIQPVADPDPPPTLTNAHTRHTLPQADALAWDAALVQGERDGGCASGPRLFYIDDADVVAAAVAAAREDGDFQRLIASALAVQDDPVAQLRAAVEVGAEAPLVSPARAWDATVERVVAAVQRDQVWILDEARGGQGHVDIAGLAGDGSALLVRVAARAEDLIATTGLTVPGVLECGDHVMQVATWAAPKPDDVGPVARAALAAVTTRACSGGGPVLRDGAGTVE